jgi:hypothetical protein
MSITHIEGVSRRKFLGITGLVTISFGFKYFGLDRLLYGENSYSKIAALYQAQGIPVPISREQLDFRSNKQQPAARVKAILIEAIPAQYDEANAALKMTISLLGTNRARDYVAKISVGGGGGDNTNRVLGVMASTVEGADYRREVRVHELVHLLHLVRGVDEADITYRKEEILTQVISNRGPEETYNRFYASLDTPGSANFYNRLCSNLFSGSVVTSTEWFSPIVDYMKRSFGFKPHYDNNGLMIAPNLSRIQQFNLGKEIRRLIGTDIAAVPESVKQVFGPLFYGTIVTEGFAGLSGKVLSGKSHSYGITDTEQQQIRDYVNLSRRPERNLELASMVNAVNGPS